MKKKTVITLVGLSILLGGLAASLLLRKHEPQITADTLLAQIERSLGANIRKQSISKIAAQYTYTSTEYNTPIYYYAIITDYYEADPTDITGLNIDAFYVLFSPEDAEHIEKIQIQTWPGCLYILAERAYLCWTVSPEESYIIEYDPKSVLYEDIVHMAQSAA